MLRVVERAIVSFPNWGNWRCRLAFLLTGAIPIAADLPQTWDTPPRVRPVTVRDFGELCVSRGFHITTEIYLRGARRIPVRRDKSLRATTAIFELRNK